MSCGYLQPGKKTGGRGKSKARQTSVNWQNFWRKMSALSMTAEGQKKLPHSETESKPESKRRSATNQG